MRISEILENITSVGSLPPDAYAAVAQQRNAAQLKNTVATQQAQQQQKAAQQQLLAKRRTVKPKPLKWHKKRIPKTRRKSSAH